MPVTAALGLRDDLQVVVRDAEAEQQALQRLAAWCYQYSSQVCIPGDRPGLFLEVEASERLFGQPRQLAQRLQQELGRLGYHAMAGSAPTLEAAWLAVHEARAPRGNGCDTPATRSAAAGSACTWNPHRSLPWSGWVFASCATCCDCRARP